MKITKTQLKQIIKEELGKVMEGLGGLGGYIGAPTGAAADEYNYPSADLMYNPPKPHPDDVGPPSCEYLLKQLRNAEANMKRYDPRQMGGMSRRMAPYDIEREYKRAGEDYDRVKAEMEKQNCPMP